jgi:hypothetical protein
MVDGQDGTVPDQGEGGALTLFPLPPLDREHEGGEGARAGATGGGAHSVMGGLENLLESAERPVLWLARGAGTALLWPLDKWANLRGEIRSWGSEEEVAAQDLAAPLPGAAPEKPWAAYWRRPVAGR